MASMSPTPLKSFHLCDLMFDRKTIEALPNIGINERIYFKGNASKEKTFIVRENNGELFAFRIDLKDVYKASLVNPTKIVCISSTEAGIRALLGGWDKVRKINFIN